MGNFSKGVSSESAKVEARCPGRKSLAEAQSLNPSPALSSGVRSLGMANAPRAATGASLSSSRRFIFLNLPSSIHILRNGKNRTQIVGGYGIRSIRQSYTISSNILSGFNVFGGFSATDSHGFEAV